MKEKLISRNLQKRNRFLFFRKLFFVFFAISFPFLSFQAIQIARGAENHLPIISPAEEESVTVDEEVPVSFTGTVSDQDGDNLTCEFFGDIPDGVERGCTAGPEITYHLNWTPTALQGGPYYNGTGTYIISLRVHDGTGYSLEKDFSITVNDTINDPPYYDPINADQTFNTREEVNIFGISVYDANGDAVSCEVDNKPEGAVLTVETDSISSLWCTLDWIPTLEQVGDYDLTLNITDGKAPVAIPIHLHVNYATNTSPSLSIYGSHTFKEDTGIILQLSDYDPNPDDHLTLGVTNMPEGAKINQTAKLFTWRPTFDQAGSYNLEFYASDGTDTTTKNFLLTIEENGSTPTEPGAENVLILVNQNSPDSIALGQYYKARRGVPEGQILSLDTSTEEGLTMANYESQIREPIKAFLNENNLKSKIKYIVPTYGIPTQIFFTQDKVDFVRQARLNGDLEYQAPYYAVDSMLADLFDTVTAKAFYDGRTADDNPYWKGTTSYYNFYADGFHFQPSHFPDGLGTYMVTRLDGTSLKIAKGLVDKAIYAGEYTGPAENNKAYVYGQPYFGGARSEICGIMEKAGYVCKQAGSYPAYDRAYDPFYDPASKKTLNPELGGDNPLWLESPGNEYYDIWGNWRPGSIPIHFQSYTAPFTIRDTKGWWESVTATLLAADATATTGTVTEPLATGLPQPAAFFDYFLNGGSGKKHYNFAESMYMSMPQIKWTNIVIGDPLYKLSDNPKTDKVSPKIENVNYSCSNSTANIYWDNFTAQDGSPEVSYGSVDYGTTNSYGSKVWDETLLEYFGVSKKNYLSEHKFQIANIDCSKQYFFKLNAIDPEENESSYSIILNKVPTPTVEQSATSTVSSGATTSPTPTPTPAKRRTIASTSASTTSQLETDQINSPAVPVNEANIVGINISNGSSSTQSLSDEKNGNSITPVQSTPLTLSGTALPYSTVEIEIHSDPIKFSTKADSNGFWSITLDRSLPTGEHRVFIAVKDEADKVIAQTDYVIEVKASVPTSSANQAQEKRSIKDYFMDKTFLFYMGIMLVLIVSAIALSLKKNQSTSHLISAN